MSDKQLVLVAGAGRSGTSSMAGALHLLGFHLPQPVLEANESNPKGFFESRWPVRFHRRLLDRAGVEQTDGRPATVSLVAAQVDDAVRAELRAWLAPQLDHHPDVMVKDPRAAWVPGLWVEQASALGARTAVVTMLRAPVEVVRSRGTHYLQNRPYMDERGFAVMNLAGWINANLAVERQTRGEARAFVRYDDLRADWRAAMRPLRDDLGLRLDHGLGPDPHPELDAFIEPALNRHVGTWDELGLPPALVALADDLAALLDRLVDLHGHDATTEAEIDEVGRRYAALYLQSQSIAVDASTALARAQYRRGLEEGRERGREEALRRGSEEPGAATLAARARRAVVRRLRRA